MYLIESEIRKIVRKNLIKHYQDQLLNEQVLSTSADLKYLTMQKTVKDDEGNETKVDVSSMRVRGEEGVLVGEDKEDFEFFIPSTYATEQTGDILFRANSNDSFVEPAEADLVIIKDFISEEDNEDNIREKFDPEKNTINNNFKALLAGSAEKMWKAVAYNGGAKFTKRLRAEIESTWGDINKYRSRKGQKPIGTLFESSIDRSSVNISVDIPKGKEGLGDVISTIVNKSTEFRGGKDSGFFKGTAQAIGSSFDDNKMTSNDAGELFSSLIGGKAGYSYYHLSLLGKAFAEETGKDLWAYMKKQKDDQMYTSGRFKDVMLTDSVLNTIPLFHLIPEGGGPPLPVYMTGKKGYENLRKALLENYSKTIGKEKKPSKEKEKKKNKGDEKIGQTPKEEITSTIYDSDKGAMRKSRGASGGIRMSVSSDSDNTVKGFDDLGFKSGTDDYIRKELRGLVKSERKFRGTGVVNLEVFFNKFGRVSKVKFRKGQGKLAARQVERMKSRIKEILVSAKYEEYRSRDEWYQDSGVKDRMDKRGRGGRNGSKVNMTVKLF
ncbi:hypothetical protein OAT38_00900 [Amylibacter sp.]|nr:hypothetical protein [Amylibacter sp.]